MVCEGLRSITTRRNRWEIITIFAKMISENQPADTWAGTERLALAIECIAQIQLLNFQCFTQILPVSLRKCN